VADNEEAGGTSQADSSMSTDEADFQEKTKRFLDNMNKMRQDDLTPTNPQTVMGASSSMSQLMSITTTSKECTEKTSTAKPVIKENQYEETVLMADVKWQRNKQASQKFEEVDVVVARPSKVSVELLNASVTDISSSTSTNVTRFNQITFFQEEQVPEHFVPLVPSKEFEVNIQSTVRKEIDSPRLVTVTVVPEVEHIMLRQVLDVIKPKDLSQAQNIGETGTPIAVRPITVSLKHGTETDIGDASMVLSGVIVIPDLVIGVASHSVTIINELVQSAVKKIVISLSKVLEETNSMECLFELGNVETGDIILGNVDVELQDPLVDQHQSLRIVQNTQSEAVLIAATQLFVQDSEKYELSTEINRNINLEMTSVAIEENTLAETAESWTVSTELHPEIARVAELTECKQLEGLHTSESLDVIERELSVESQGSGSRNHSDESGEEIFFDALDRSSVVRTQLSTSDSSEAYEPPELIDTAEVESMVEIDTTEVESTLGMDTAEVESTLGMDTAEVESILGMDTAEVESTLGIDTADVESTLGAPALDMEMSESDLSELVDLNLDSKMSASASEADWDWFEKQLQKDIKSEIVVSKEEFNTVGAAALVSETGSQIIDDTKIKVDSQNDKDEAQNRIADEIQPRIPEFVLTLDDLTTTDGAKTTFACHLVGSPTPVVTWYVDGEVIKESADFCIGYDEYGVCSLVILDTLIEDEGEYTAKAVNELGACQTVSYLTVLRMYTWKRF